MHPRHGLSARAVPLTSCDFRQMVMSRVRRDGGLGEHQNCILHTSALIARLGVVEDHERHHLSECFAHRQDEIVDRRLL